GGDQGEGAGAEPDEHVRAVPGGLLPDLPLDPQQGAEQESGHQQLDLDEAGVREYSDERFHGIGAFVTSLACRRTGSSGCRTCTDVSRSRTTERTDHRDVPCRTKPSRLRDLVAMHALRRTRDDLSAAETRLRHPFTH